MAEPQNAPAPAPKSAAPAPHTPAVPATATDQLPPQPHYKEGTLTRAGMDHVLKAGGSVLVNGRIINSVAALPSEAEMARGDTDAEAAALENINRQRAALDAQEAQLKATRPATPAKK